MPHFIIECNLEHATEEVKRKLMQSVLQTSIDSKLFKKQDIKIRMNILSDYLIGGENKNFIHVWGYLLKGRSDSQKHALSEALLASLCKNSKDVGNISVNIEELSEAGYCKK